MPDQTPTTAPTLDTTNPSRPATGGQVMDIQSPKPSTAQTTDENSPVNISSGGPAEINTDSPTIAEPPAIEESVVESPAEPTIETNSSNTDTSVTTEPTEPTEPAADNVPNPLAATPPTGPKKSGKPMLVIVIAVVIALALAALVVVIFLKPKKNTAGTTNSTSNQTAPKPLASPADVDNTNKEIDTSLSKVNDSTDFASTDLSDKALGL